MDLTTAFYSSVLAIAGSVLLGEIFCPSYIYRVYVACGIAEEQPNDTEYAQLEHIRFGI